MASDAQTGGRALTLSGIGGSLLAKAACPACWTLVAGGLGSLGVAVELSIGTLRVLGRVFLVLALGALAWHAPHRRGHGPFALGFVGAVASGWESMSLHPRHSRFRAFSSSSLRHSGTPGRDVCATFVSSALFVVPFPLKETLTMASRIEVFSAGCSLCQDAVRLAESFGEVEVVDLRSADAAKRAKAYGISRVPAVVVDGRLADCCQRQQEPVSIETLRRHTTSHS
jgi:glutaredoxin 3